MDNIKKVLIAEDSPTQAMQLQMILEEYGYEVLYGINGKEAYDLLDEDNLPDMIISDIIMPEMDGYEFCSKVKGNEKTKNIPVILLTQLSKPDDVIKGLQSGADNFISKPYSDKFLFDRISDIMLNQEIRKRSPNLDINMEIYFGGQKYRLNSNRMQILDLLLSTYYNAINKNQELEDKNIELKKLHKEMKIKNIQLKKLNEEKNQIMGIAAHDLRSPLCTLSGYLYLVTESLEENMIPDQDKIFSTLNRTTDYMLNLITDVLDYSKIEAGQIELKKEKFDLVAFMDEVIEMNNILASPKNITIHSGYTDDEIIVIADSNKIKQVMDNLLSNAIKYSEQNTMVIVNFTILENELQISVIDQGKGIPIAEQDKLFKPFATTSVKSTGGEKSTGLGLVSVKKIVETHGGRIWLKSKEGVGSQLFFTIPHTSSGIKDIAKRNENSLVANTDTQSSKTKKFKILIAEDDETVNKFLSLVLKDIGKEIFLAKTGLEALDIFRDNKDIDLIIMDIQMPVMDGLEATREIRKLSTGVKIIAQTAFAMSGDEQESLDAGCDNYIAKPIRKNALLEMINKLFL